MIIIIKMKKIFLMRSDMRNEIRAGILTIFITIFVFTCIGSLIFIINCLISDFVCDTTMKVEDCPSGIYYSELYSVKIPKDLIYHKIGLYRRAGGYLEKRQTDISVLFDVSEIYKYNQTLSIEPYEYNNITTYIKPEMKLCAMKGWDTTVEAVYSSSFEEKVDVVLKPNGECVYYYTRFTYFYPYKSIETLTYIFGGLMSSYILIFILGCMCCRGYFCNDITVEPMPVPKPKSNSNNKNITGTCTICLENFNTDSSVTELICGHNYHYECLINWIKNDKHNCPMCRRKIESKIAIDINPTILCVGEKLNQKM